MSPFERERSTRFVDSIGEVPSGPRSSSRSQFYSSSSGRSPRGTSVSSSAFSYPSRRSQSPDCFPPLQSRTGRRRSPDYFPPLQSRSRRRRSVPILPKEEEVEQDIRSFPSASSDDTDQTTNTADDVKREPSVEAGEIDEDPFKGNQFDRFRQLFARSSASIRSDSWGSRRQDTSEGSLRRSDVPSRSYNRTRSRSPRRLIDPRDDVRRDSRSSSMFVSDRQESVSLGTDQNISITTTQTPERPSLQPISEDEDPRCRCPIGYLCSKRSVNHLDCRPLVREYGTWAERRDQESFELHREAGSRGERFVTDQDLQKIIGYIGKFMSSTTTTANQTAVLHIRGWVLDMEDVTITDGIQQTIISQQVVPALKAFLAQANASIRRSKHLPKYLDEELTVLERKWGRTDFSGSTTRGLTLVTVYDVNGNPKYSRYQVDTTWPFYTSAIYSGAGQLVNGQIWESRVELQRDGVHAPSIAGISGTVKEGARSILLGAFDERNNLGYADIDMGDIIEYVGTALRDQEGLGPTNVKDPHMNIPGAWDPNSQVKPTKATQAMFKSLETGEPVRVIRSWKMCKIVKNKPVKGYRYDGLYQVIGATALKEARQIWSFRLQRLPEQLPHQGPLRGFSTAWAQPSSIGRRIGHFHK